MRYLVFSDLLNKTFDTMEEAEAAEKAELDRIKKEEDKKKAEESAKAELKKKIENNYLLLTFDGIKGKDSLFVRWIYE